ncbi:MAG TPA: AmmeMemoRadiSam system protein A, partial [Candidatus Hydrogenedentes bacterium]|nr:AmmeMemoRadiSam system protein A [Candidatus Hydrogenedentota bacterium]
MQNHLLSSETFLSREEECLLLRIARASLTTWVLHGKRLDLEDFPLTPALETRCGVFVTLRAHKALRGCIGTVKARDALARAVLEYVINAASHDPRFHPLQLHELETTTIELSALSPGDEVDSPLRRVNDISEIVVGRDGLYIERPPHRGGLLLPQVAVEHDMSVLDFLNAVCRKANYPERAWELEGTRLFRFTAQVFGEPSSG